MMIKPQLWSRSGARRTCPAAIPSVNGGRANARTGIGDDHAAMSVPGRPDARDRRMRYQSALRARRRWAP
jgi:hypothetical protein